MQQHPLTRVYLFLFNVCSTLLWGYIACLTFRHLSHHGFEAPAIFWDVIEFPIIVAQSAAALEIVHALFGLVRSPVVTTAMQVVSRLQLVWVVWQFVAEAHLISWTLSCIVAWSLAELIRYPFYAFNIVTQGNGTPYVLKWLRYSGFLVLYPLGITSEVMCILAALPFMRSSAELRAFPYAMPNRWNFQVDLFVLYCAVLALYVPGTFKLYGFMWRQRGKALSAPAVEDKGKTQ